MQILIMELSYFLFHAPARSLFCSLFIATKESKRNHKPSSKARVTVETRGVLLELRAQGEETRLWSDALWGAIILRNASLCNLAYLHYSENCFKQKLLELARASVAYKNLHTFSVFQSILVSSEEDINSYGKI